MFNRKGNPAVVYKFGCKPPLPEHTDVMEQQFELAGHYYNALIKIERRRRWRGETARRAASPEWERCEQVIGALDEAVETLAAKIKRQRAHTRRRTTSRLDQAAMRDVKELRARERRRRRWLYYVLREDDSLTAQLDEINRCSYAERRAARRACGLYWGTYELIEQAAEKACRSITWPAYRNQWRRQRLAVRYQKGTSPESLFEGTSACGLTIVKDRGKRGLICHARLRVATDKRKSIDVTIPVVLHRPFPDDAEIRSVHLVRNKMETKDKYELQFVLSREGGWSPPVGSRTVALDLGYRRVPGGLRVAYFFGSDGEEGSLVLPERWLEGWDQLAEISSMRDLNFGAARGVLCRALAAASAVPEWLTEAAAHLEKWKSPRRLRELIEVWRERRWDGDGDLYDTANAWRVQDKHLGEWGEGLRRDLIEQRRHTYYNFAAQLRKNYGTVRMEKLDLRTLAKRPEPEESARDGALVEHRVKAALSILTVILDHSGMEIIKVNPAYSTRCCHRCGAINEFAQPQRLLQTCGECGARWDQDQNAAMNLLDGWNAEKAATCAGAT